MQGAEDESPVFAQNERGHPVSDDKSSDSRDGSRCAIGRSSLVIPPGSANSPINPAWSETAGDSTRTGGYHGSTEEASDGTERQLDRAHQAA